MIKYIIDSNNEVFLCNVAEDGTPTPVPIEEYDGVLAPETEELEAPPEEP